MALAGTKDPSSWYSKHTMPSNNGLIVSNASFKLDKVLLAKKSATIASLLENNPYEDLSAFLEEIPSEPETLELIARFCHGLEVTMTSNNIISLICLTNHLKMTESHCPNNLFNNALLFLQQNILPNWDQIIRSFRATSWPTFKQAVEIGLLDHLVEALTAQVLSEPTLLAQPIMIEYNNKNRNNRPIDNTIIVTRRKLFDDAQHSNTSPDSDTSVEDLTSLPVEKYEIIIDGMKQRQAPPEYIVGSLYRYLNKHGDNSKEAIEAIERLLPTNNKTRPLYPYTMLFEMHALAVSLEATSGCVTSLENRIGMELDRVTAEDLLVLDLDVESLRRILKGYYGNFTDPNPSRLVRVAEIMEEYLFEVAKEREIDGRSFVEIAEMTCSTSNVGSYRCYDGIYRAVDAYLDKHKELSDFEREEICRVLDFQKMSSEACRHAAMNRRLPIRVVVQVLFVSQLQLKENVSKAVGEYCSNHSSNVVEEGSRRRGINEIKVVEDEDEDGDDNDDEREGIKTEEFHEKNCCGNKCKKKVSLWKGMKRKFGCMRGSNSDYESLHNCNCQVTRKMNKKKKSSLNL